MNVGNKITQKPHSSWVLFYPIIQLFFRCGIPYFRKKTVLFYKHGIAEGEKAVFFSHSLFISCHNMLLSSQCRYQHHQCGLRQMEIGDQSVDHLEAVTRIDKDLGPAASGF